MIAWWEPRREGPVDLSEVKNWIIDLRRNGFNLGLVTFDRWQSFDIQRDLKSVGINTETLSVAKKHYEDLAMLFYEERVVAPHIEILLEELLELRIVSNNKVDHPRKKSKDLADAMCGSVYNAISHSKKNTFGEIEVHTWSSFKADRNRELIEEKEKPQMTDDIKNYLSNYKLI
jgi:phage terminase large subunit-like protein